MAPSATLIFKRKWYPWLHQFPPKWYPWLEKIRSKFFVLSWKIQRSTYSFYQFLLNMSTMKCLLSEATKDESMAAPLPNMIPFARPKLPKSISLVRLEIRKSIPSFVVHPQVPLLWKNPPPPVIARTFFNKPTVNSPSTHLSTLLIKSSSSSSSSAVLVQEPRTWAEKLYGKIC